MLVIFETFHEIYRLNALFSSLCKKTRVFLIDLPRLVRCSSQSKAGEPILWGYWRDVPVVTNHDMILISFKPLANYNQL